ncbi:hypothetical protein FACS1894211_01860 [Clostridia bacterium]|nr:hypothetical protein FACS1894211_01860 [Clostridia bacterium]
MSALIILSLAISGALLFVALSIADVLDTVADSEFQSVTTVFLLIFVVTSFMSVFVVFSSFKYVMALRVKTLGTLRSIGADKKRCGNLLLLESVVYGLISAVFAAAAGIVLLLILGKALSGGTAALVISPTYILITVLFCLLLSPICAYLPVRASEKYSVKELILQTHRIKEKKRLPVLLVGLALTAIGVLLVLINALKYEEWAVYCSLFVSLAGFVLCVGPLVHYFMALLGKVFSNNFTVRNMRENRSHNTIAVLLAIAVAVVFMVNSANAILIGATDKSFALYNYDIHISTKTNDAIYSAAEVAQVGGVSGITAADGIYYQSEADAGGHIPVMNLYGMSLSKMNAYFNLTTEEEITAQDAKTILLSRDYLEREKLAKGDTITVGNAEFEIAGIIKEMFNSGNVGVLSEGDFEELYGVSRYTLIAAKSDIPDAARNALRAEGFQTAATVADMLARIKSINADLFTTVNYIIVLSTTAGVFGVLNNLLIAFASRKRERALLRSIGMSKRQSAKTILVEALITGLTGGSLGLVGGLLLTAVIPAVFLVFEFPVKSVPLSPAAITLCIICSAAICLLASLISLISNSKLNVIQTLREEIL